MSTLDIKKWTKKYILISIICFIISLIYESLSHGVYSLYMILAGLIPLVFGLILTNICRNIKMNRLGFNLYNSFIALLTMGMYMSGILKIYGTNNNLVLIYYIMALVMLIIAVIIIKIKS